MTLPLTSRPDHPLEPAAAKATSTQLFGVLYITLTGLVDSVVPNSGPWSLLGRSLSYIIILAPILWWALPASLTTLHPKPPNASTYDWLPDMMALPPPSSDPQDEPKEYSKKFKASGNMDWDPLANHNICNVDREFKVPK
ncbi:hypothetical protein DSO57_1030679 [Entomophthora muscae]|uniref:Uncharacterized protein n=1 Tax=Entomophthora muscae TaxID=34485 RepID=A0ACC2RFN7_9FUNG|nr:hypothetical protein DSO57_1030679 [Entomophthora muscae]